MTTTRPEAGSNRRRATSSAARQTYCPRLGYRVGFTLIELMVVMGIVALLLTISVPTIYRQLHPESMQKAVSDVMEACSHARAMAILNGVVTELRIQPRERAISVAQSSGQRSALDALSSPDVGGNDWRMPDRLSSPDVSGNEWRMADRGGKRTGAQVGSFSVTLSEKITIEGLGINGLDYTEDETAYVQFYPNGTSDEMSIVLLSDTGERRNIWLEVVTALAELETDPYKFRAR
jgi:prepilin-type N-terminal cleavage/methylation domain-containing protein